MSVAGAGALSSPARARTRTTGAAWVLAGAGVLSQVAFPLTGGGTFALTVASVLCFSSAAIVHALATRGALAAASVVAVAGGGGLVAEAVGVHTGYPFGGYHYTGSLGTEVLGVPLLVPLAWVSMAWPALVVARRLTRQRHRAVTALVGGWALAAWDVFLDPQMVEAGHWTWDSPSPALPGVAGIPLTNYVGWLLVSTVLVAGLDRVVTARTSGDALPVVVYLWTYASSVLGAAVFFARPSVAVVGAVVMGLVAVPVALRGRDR